MASIKGDSIAVLEPDALTVDTAAYATGELIGKHTGGKLTFTNAFSGPGKGGRLVQVILTDDGAQSAAIDLVLFSSDPSATTFTDQSALDIADADLDKIIGIVSLAAASYKAFADNSAIVATAGPIDIVTDSGTLYGALVSRGSPDYVAATDLTLRLVIERE